LVGPPVGVQAGSNAMPTTAQSDTLASLRSASTGIAGQVSVGVNRHVDDALARTGTGPWTT
jgi:hypothetical protein